MSQFYDEFFTRIANSPAHAEFCRKVYGRDLGQHGMLEMEQLELLLHLVPLGPATRVLELGCGNGRLAQYLAQRTGARITGLDLSPTGIAFAQSLAAQSPRQLDFVCADMARWEYPSAAFDVVLGVDALQFVPDLHSLLPHIRTCLRTGGILAVFFSTWAEEDQPDERLGLDTNRMAVALRETGWEYETRDLREQEMAHWQRKYEVLREMRPAFEAEGNGFIYERRMLEAEYHQRYLKTGRVARYLYLARPLAG